MTITDGPRAGTHLRIESDDGAHARLTAHYGWVRAVARNLVRDPWGAEDVTQETLLAALRAPPPAAGRGRRPPPARLARARGLHPLAPRLAPARAPARARAARGAQRGPA